MGKYKIFGVGQCRAVVYPENDEHPVDLDEPAVCYGDRGGTSAARWTNHYWPEKFCTFGEWSWRAGSLTLIIPTLVYLLIITFLIT